MQRNLSLPEGSFVTTAVNLHPVEKFRVDWQQGLALFPFIQPRKLTLDWCLKYSKLTCSIRSTSQLHIYMSKKTIRRNSLNLPNQKWKPHLEKPITVMLTIKAIIPNKYKSILRQKLHGLHQYDLALLLAYRLNASIHNLIISKADGQWRITSQHHIIKEETNNLLTAGLRKFSAEQKTLLNVLLTVHCIIPV
jgi:hypothetical protein